MSRTIWSLGIPSSFESAIATLSTVEIRQLECDTDSSEEIAALETSASSASSS